jgi:hypothetical protein
MERHQWGVSSIGRAVSVSITRLQVRVLYSPLTFKLNQMDVNQIEVHDFVDLSPSKETMRAIEIENAKKLLRSEGYYVDNLWQTCDVTLNYDCTEEEAQGVLNSAFTNDATYQQIWEAISYKAESMNLKRRD